MLVGSDDGTVYFLNAQSGENYYTRDFDGPVVTKPYIVDFKQKGQSNMWMHAGSADSDGQHYGNYVTSRERVSNRLIRRNQLIYHARAPTYSSPTARYDYHRTDTTYYGVDDGTVRTLKLPAGGGFVGEDWTFQTDGKVRSSPAVTRNPVHVYFGSWDGNVYAVDGPYGELQWQSETGGKIESSPAVADGVLYVGSADQHVYTLDAETGDRLWDFRTGGAVSSSPAVVNGTVFVVSDDGHVYALTTCE